MRAKDGEIFFSYPVCQPDTDPDKGSLPTLPVQLCLLSPDSQALFFLPSLSVALSFLAACTVIVLCIIHPSLTKEARVWLQLKAPNLLTCSLSPGTCSLDLLWVPGSSCRPSRCAPQRCGPVVMHKHRVGRVFRQLWICVLTAGFLYSEHYALLSLSKVELKTNCCHPGLEHWDRNGLVEQQIW